MSLCVCICVCREHWSSRHDCKFSVLAAAQAGQNTMEQAQMSVGQVADFSCAQLHSVQMSQICNRLLA